MRKLLEQKKEHALKHQETMAAEAAKAEIERVMREQQEEQRRIREAEEQKKREQEEEIKRQKLAERGLEDLVSEAAKLEFTELVEVDHQMNELEHQKSKEEIFDPEARFLKDEEDQIQKFYEKLFPPDMKKHGMPDFSNFLQILKDNELRQAGKIGEIFQAPIIQQSELIF